MMQERYEYYVARTQELFPDLVRQYQNEFLRSASKGEDFYLCCHFFGMFADTIADSDVDTITEFRELFSDENAIYPMPKSVAKQLVNALFHIENLSILYDVPIDAGLDDVDVRKFNKDDVVADFNAYFDSMEEEDEIEQ